VNRARIDIARNTARISLLDFRKAVEEATTNVEQAYWQLVAAQREVEIQEQRVRGAEQTADVISTRLEVDQSRLQLNQAQAEAETRRANLIRARSRVNDLSDQIKQLMNDPDMPVGSVEVLVAESGPLDQPVRFDLDELIDTALQNRLELAQQQLRVDNATVTLGAAKNNLLPNLQFQGQVNPSGLGPNFSDAISSQNEYNKISYSAGLQLEIPIGNREARAIYRRTQLQRTQAITQYRSLQEQVVLDVRVQHRDVETSYQELARARAARFSREKAIQAILAQEAAREPLSPQFVDLKLRQQDFLAEAQSAEATALSNYNVAIARLERAKGTLLRYNNISLDEKGIRRQLTR
jgi:outer membrane protein TolC